MRLHDSQRNPRLSGGEDVKLIGVERMNSKLFKCLYCGRNLGAACAHRCKGNMRKRNLIFRHRVTNIIVGNKETVRRFFENNAKADMPRMRHGTFWRGWK